MLLIVAHHYVVNSGLMWNGPIDEDSTSIPSLFYELFGMWGKTGINCFVMITGYFMCTSVITLRKFLKLYLEVFFYGIVLNSLFFICGYGEVSVLNILRSLFPFASVSSNFVTCFILFWMGIPFYNILIRNMTVRQHKMIIIWLLSIYTFLQYTPGFKNLSMNYVSWFFVLYLIASYIRLYPETIKKHDNARYWGIWTVALMFIAMLSVVTVAWFDNVFSKSKSAYWLVSDSNAILALCIGISSFMLFLNLDIKQSKWINSIAATTFGVLLIHANSNTMRQWLWKDCVDCVGHYSVPYYWLYAPVAVIVIFGVCSLIDYIRIHTVEKLLFKYIDRYLQVR